MELHDVPTIAGLSLTIIGTLLLWNIHVFLGLSFSIFVIAVFSWYLMSKREGDLYLKRVAELLDCSFRHRRTAYGDVTGSYRKKRIVIEVKSSYDTSSGITGMIASISALDSMIGSLAGLENFTLVRIGHNAMITHPFKLMEGAYITSREVLYIPPCKSSGLPKISPEHLVSKISDLLDVIEELESG